MTAKTTIITSLLAVCLVLVAVMTSGTQRIWRGGAMGSSPLVDELGLPVDSVSRIMVERRGEPRLVIERRAHGAWQQVEPFAHPMDAFAVRQLITAAREVMVVDRMGADELRDGLTLATLGLQPAEAQMTYEWGDQTLRIALGRRGIAGRAYAMLGTADRSAEPDMNDVLIISQELHERVIETTPKEWRDRTLFRGAGIECERIERDAGRGARLVLERDRRTWRMLEPVLTRADRHAVELFMQQLGGARSAGFITDQPATATLARYGLEPPAATLAVTCTRVDTAGEDIERTPETRTLLIGNPAGAGTQDRFGLLDGMNTIVRLPLNMLQGLFVPAEALIDPTGSGAIAADVKSIRILSDDGEVRLERDMEKWYAPIGDARREVPATVVQELLVKLTEFRASEVVIQEYPRELERAVVTLFGFDGGPLDTVRIVHDPASGQWGLENGDNVMRIFPREFQPSITPRDFNVQ